MTDNIKENKKSELENMMSTYFNTIQSVSKSKNTFEITEFIRRFGKLYQKRDNITNQEALEIQQLSLEFRTSIDLYEPIKLVDKAGNLLLEFPPVFCEVKELKEGMKQLQDRIRLLVNQNLRDYEHEQITMEFFNGILKSQIDDDTDDYFSYMKEKTKQFHEMTNKANELINEAKQGDVNIKSNSDNNQTKEEDFTDMLFESSSNDTEDEDISNSSLLDEIF